MAGVVGEGTQNSNAMMAQAGCWPPDALSNGADERSATER